MAVLCRAGLPIPVSIQHRVWGKGPQIFNEVDRVKGTGGWISDGRVCDILAVSRAFGDWEFKGEGLQALVKKGTELGYWDQQFAAGVHFSADPVIATPDVSQVRRVGARERLFRF